jgi:hypothetical protein
VSDGEKLSDGNERRCYQKPFILFWFDYKEGTKTMATDNPVAMMIISQLGPSADLSAITINLDLERWELGE